MSLFNRPTWAMAHTTEDDDDDDDGGEVNMFRHAEKSFTDVMAEEQRRKKEKAEREKSRAEHKKIKAERRSSGKHKREDDNDDGGLKKRRITLEDSKKLLSSIWIPTDGASGAGSDDEPEGEAGPVRRSPRKNRQNRNAKPQQRHRSTSVDVVEINDGAVDDEPVIRHVASVEGSEDGEEDDDDDFAELRRLARLQREQKETQNRLSGGSNGAAQDSSEYRQPDDEPIVQLFIDSPIENTKPLLVQRKLSQSLEIVLKAWCGKQPFSAEVASKVFFVHRMRRLYNVSTCRTIGLEVNSFGDLTMKGAEGKEGVDRVHLQAVTPEIYEEMKAEKKLEAKRRSGELAEEQADAGAEAEEPEEDNRFIIVLRAKNHDDMRMKVRPVSRQISQGDTWMTDLHSPEHTFRQDRKRLPQKLGQPTAETGSRWR